MSGEVFLPGSKSAFKPLNPWGRPMPKPNRAMRRRATLYQVHVEQDGKQIPVGPKTDNPGMAEKFCEAIGVMIARGQEKTWSSPTVVAIREKTDSRKIGDVLFRP